MARISEFEQTASDNVEVAITQAEYDALATSSPYRVEIYDFNGDAVDHWDLPTTPSSWVYDSDTSEWIYVQEIPLAQYNHNAQYCSIALGQTAPSLQVFDAYSISTFGFDNTAKLPTAINTSSFLPVGTPFEVINQSTYTVDPDAGNTEATVRWDYPKPGSYVVEKGSSLGDTGILCFGRGTSIETSDGPVAVENLKVGDKVRTLDGHFEPIRWIGCDLVSANKLARNQKLRPIRVEANALGNGLPETDLIVSPQHRIMLGKELTDGLFDHEEVLVKAKDLLEIRGVTIARDVDVVEYYHIMFEKHEIIFANGLPAESLFTGKQAIKTLGKEAREEIFAIFPELESDDRDAQMARPFVNRRVLAEKLN